jgi:Fe-S-cluster containining protein
MQKTIPIRIVQDCIIENCPAGDSSYIGLELNIYGKKLNFKIIACGNARLADIVPAAAAICDKIIDITIEYKRSKNENVPCRKGCSACCDYFVPLSPPEALYFRQEIFNKPLFQHNLVMRKYLHAANWLIKHSPPKQVLDSFSKISAGSPEMKALADWYAGLKITCPFLRDGLCTIYKQRPFVCREHFVSGPAGGCHGKSRKMQIIDMPVQMGNLLCRLSRELCGVNEAVILPFALAWCDINNRLCERTWPAEAMVKLLVKIIKEIFPFSL